MAGSVRTHRSSEVTGVVITADNIRELASHLAQQQSPDPAHTDQDTVTFTLRCADGTKFTADHLGLLQEGGRLDTRRIVGIDLSYENQRSCRHFDISLQHGGGRHSSYNSMTVSGTDETWVDGNIQWFNDCVSNWRKQATWPHEYYSLLLAGLSVAFFVPLAGIVALVMLLFGWPTEDTHEIIKLGYSAGGALIIVGIAHSVVTWLQTSYPKVELAVGPEHHQFEKARRKKIRSIIGLAVAPLVFSLLAGLLLRILP
ncbi:MAG TPA: hypothetical protein VM537_10600 [Anaerolineae bacterium]|nr:hypothetical protein [Anaerolineae bacterium]